MKKHRFIVYVYMFIVMLALVLSGCQNASEPKSTETEPTAPTTTLTAPTTTLTEPTTAPTAPTTTPTEPVGCNHSETEWIVDKRATCEKDGQRHLECKSCKAVLKTETLPAAHDLVSFPGKAPTDTEAGHTSWTRCPNCFYYSELKLPIPSLKPTPGLKYKVNADGKTCTILPITTLSTRDLNIPAEIDGYKVTAIEAGAFRSVALDSINIPEGVLHIGEGILLNHPTIKTVYLPSTLLSIGDDAFAGCTSLTYLNIPESVTYIGRGIVKNAPLTYTPATWEGNLRYIGSYCVEAAGTYSDDPVVVRDGTKYLASKLFYYYKFYDGVVLPDSLLSIGDYAFYGSNLYRIALPDQLQYIGDYAFQQTNLESVKLPNQLQKLGVGAFFSCAKLTEVQLPDTLTEIPNSAFESCRKLDQIVIPNTVKSIGNSAFASCALSKDLIIPESVTKIGEGAFSNCRFSSVKLPSGITEIPRGAFASCESLTSITLPSQITSIGGEAFSNCEGLTSIVIPNTVKSIGNSAFAYCTKLSEIQLPSNLTAIAPYAFDSCFALTSITLPAGVTEIGECAFHQCSHLVTLSIPASVTYIDRAAVNTCHKLAEIRFNGTVAQWNSIQKHEEWNYKIDSFTVYCSDGEVKMK